MNAVTDSTILHRAMIRSTSMTGVCLIDDDHRRVPASTATRSQADLQSLRPRAARPAAEAERPDPVEGRRRADFGSAGARRQYCARRLLTETLPSPVVMSYPGVAWLSPVSPSTMSW